MRICFTVAICVLLNSCSELKNLEGLNYTAGNLLGGYKDLQTTTENHCKAKYDAAIPYHKKVDLGYLRALDVCHQNGFQYFELVAIEKYREEEINEYDKQIIYSPIVEIAGYVDSGVGRQAIKPYAESIKQRNNLDLPIF